MPVNIYQASSEVATATVKTIGRLQSALLADDGSTPTARANLDLLDAAGSEGPDAGAQDVGEALNRYRAYVYHVIGAQTSEC